MFPSRPRILAPVVSLPRLPHSIRRLSRVSKREAPSPIQCATSMGHDSLRLYLNTFRGEPAISEFAWHFTANRSSSGLFATNLGSALHRRVPPASAWPRVDHPVSGRSQTTRRPFGLAFAPAPPVPGLASPPGLTRRLILQKARRHRIAPAPTGRKRMVSGSLSLPSPGCFSPFPHGTGALSVVGGM